MIETIGTHETADGAGQSCFPRSLSAAEQRVIAAVAAQGSAKGAARELGLSRRTVETHLLHIRLKIGTKTTKQALELWTNGRAA